MATFISLHIKSDNQAHILKLLQELSEPDEMITDSNLKELYNNILHDDKVNPTQIAVGKSKSGWIPVYINSFKKLYEWLEKISKDLNTTCIQIMGQTVTDAYYFLMYDNGILKREIEVCHEDLDHITDKGEKLSFEKPSLVDPENEGFENVFDRDTLEYYCKEFGFDLFDNDQVQLYFIFKKGTLGVTINKYLESYSKSKPWWKFW